MEPDDVDALRSYEVSLEAMSRDEELIDVLERREGLEYDFEEKKVVLRRIADIATNRLADLPRAAKAFESLVSHDESDIEAIDALMGIRTETEDWDGVIELMHMRLSHTPDTAEANAHRHRLVELLRTVKEDAEQAIEVLNEILSVDPEDDRAVAILEELYEATEKWFDLKELIISRMDRVEDDAIRAHTFKRLASLSEERFEDMDDALQYRRPPRAIPRPSWRCSSGSARSTTSSSRIRAVPSSTTRRCSSANRTTCSRSTPWPICTSRPASGRSASRSWIRPPSTRRRPTSWGRSSTASA
jgi:tetratricopeptide (TPR) repeat protein